MYCRGLYFFIDTSFFFICKKWFIFPLNVMQNDLGICIHYAQGFIRKLCLTNVISKAGKPRTCKSMVRLTIE